MARYYKDNLLEGKQTREKFSHLRDVFFAVLVFTILVLPRNFQVAKMIMIFFIFIFHVLSKTRSVYFNKIVILFLFYYAYVLIGTFIGVANKNPGVGGYFKVEFLWFTLNLMVFSMFRKSTIKYILKAVIIASFVISVYNILLLLLAIMGFDSTWLSQIDPTANVGIHEGYTHITSTNISMMMFSLPVVCGLYLFVEKRTLASININKIFLLITLIATVLTMFLSGRRILWLVMAIVFFLCLFNNRSLSKNQRKSKRTFYIALVLIGLMFVIFLILIGKFDGIVRRFLDAFISTGTEENIRTIEIRELWKGFLKSPIFGHGFGLGVGDKVPGYGVKYEVTYNEMLFNVGIIGTLMYVICMGGFLFSIYNEYKKSKSYRHCLFISLVILVVIFFSTATNPYLGSSFDFYLFLFFPIAIYQCSLRERQEDFKNHIKTKINYL